MKILEDIREKIEADGYGDAFDSEILMLINAAIFDLESAAKLPEFTATEESVWTDYLKDNQPIDPIKTFIWLSVKLKFDPPSTSFVLEAMKEEHKQALFRLQIKYDNWEEEETK